MFSRALLFGLFVAIAILTFSCGTSSHDKLVGEWKGTDNTGMAMLLILQADGTAKLTNGDTVIDGGSVGGKVEWTVNDKALPILLELGLTDAKGSRRPIRMIVRFLTDDKIQLGRGKDLQVPPNQFSESDNSGQIALLRQK